MTASESMVGMKWKVVILSLAILVILYCLGAVLLGTFGMDIHWRGFHG